MEQPLIRKRRSLSPIWILPLVALCIGGWLLYTGIRNAGIEITVHFVDATGITPGKTKVIVRGIPVGTVQKIEIDEKMQGVNLVIEMGSKTRFALVQDTKFWIVKPEISAGRITGLDTLLGGSYLSMHKGNSTVFADHFEGLADPPSIDSGIPGLHFTLETDTLYSLQRGSNIYAKNMVIGHVEDYILREDGTIQLKGFVEERFAHMIRNGTRFWNSSGLSLTGDMQSGLTVNIESLASLIYGGITCATPASLIKGEPAQNNAIFKLYKDFEDAEYGLPITLKLASADGIVVGKTKVIYQGLKVGVVKSVDFSDSQLSSVAATVLIDPRMEPMLREETRFWVVRSTVALTGIKHLETLITGPYITCIRGDGPYRDSFIEETAPMPEAMARAGLTYTLLAPDSGGLTVGAPLYYKRIQVGEVSGIALAPESDGVRIHLVLYKEHSELITENSVFWRDGGLRLDAGLTRFQVDVGSLQSMVAGGISFMNPSKGKGSSVPAKEESSFKLFASFNEATRDVPALNPIGLHLQLIAAQSPSLTVGAPVLYNNIKVGEVLGFDLAANRRDALIRILIEPEYQDLATSGSRFYSYSGINFNASTQGVSFRTAPFEALINGGIAFFTEGGGRSARSGQNFPLYASRQEALDADRLSLALHCKKAECMSTNTEIRYQGLVIGKVSQVKLKLPEGILRGEARVDRNMAEIFRRGTTLHLVKPEIAISGVRHLQTLITGNYIEVRPGAGSLRTNFAVLPPETDGAKPDKGLNIVLETPSLGSLKIGSPLYYRQVQVGQVTSYQLSPTAQKVWLKVNVEPTYTKLIYTGTKFWNASGIKVSGGLLSEMTMRTESMEALLAGGIALATPEGERMGQLAVAGTRFELAETFEDEWLCWQPPLMPLQQRQQQVSPQTGTQADRRVGKKTGESGQGVKQQVEEKVGKQVRPKRSTGTESGKSRKAAQQNTVKGQQ